MSSNSNALIDSKLEKFEPVPALAGVESDSASADTILVSFAYLVILEIMYAPMKICYSSFKKTIY